MGRARTASDRHTGRHPHRSGIHGKGSSCRQERKPFTFIDPDELSDDGAIFSVDVCGQHYESTILTKAWRAAQENTVPIDQRIALALCEIKEYRDLTLESMYEINYPREEVEKQISSYKGELYFDFKAPEGQNIVVRPEPRNGEDGGTVLRLCCEHVVAHLAVAEEPRCQVCRRCSGISASLSPFSRLSRNLR
ncbi:MAG: hypothetical protein ACI4TC_06645 [Kiritimatiellia bacterium]